MIIKKFRKICGLVAIAGLSAITTFPAMSATDAEIEANIDRLLSQMTLDEKVGQLNQLSGTGYSDGMIRDIRAGKIGSILNEVDAETVNKLQREAMENTRLHIPIIFSRDVIHGFKTIFPIPIGQAATWRPEMVEQGSRISAREIGRASCRERV